MKKIDEIQDDELRVIGTRREESCQQRVKDFDLPLAIDKSVAMSEMDLPDSKHGKRTGLIIFFIILLILVALFVIKHCKAKEDIEKTVQTTELEVSQIDRTEWLGNYSTTDMAYVECLQQTINDIPLDIYIPHNAEPTLSIGTPDTTTTDIIFTTQAADIRADNGKINGAYVIAGEPKAWGRSKMGYVAIIDGTISIGVAENTLLFEEATEKGGYFFRQYALVDNGQLVENEPKGKSIRKAICSRKGETIIVFSATRESFHDFAQALVDMGIDNAVYLVGGMSNGFYRNADGNAVILYDPLPENREFENHIQWKIKPKYI